MRSCCLSSKDSAMTERTPPGRASLARVTTNCTARRIKSRIVKAGYHGHRSAQDCSYTAPHAMIREFAPHTVNRMSNVWSSRRKTSLPMSGHPGRGFDEQGKADLVVGQPVGRIGGRREGLAIEAAHGATDFLFVEPVVARAQRQGQCFRNDIDVDRTECDLLICAVTMIS